MSEAPQTSSDLTREAVLAVLRANPSFGKREIARALKLDAAQKRDLRALLQELETDGLIHRSGRRAYVAGDDLPPVAVLEVVERDPEGDLLARPARRRPDAGDETSAEPRIHIAARDADGRRGRPSLGLGDRVLARLSRDSEGVWRAKVLKALGKDGRKTLGVVRASGAHKRVEPVSRQIKNAFALTAKDQAKLSEGDLVVVTAQHERRHGLKTAEVLEVIGDASAPNAASLIALHEHGIPDGFSDAELAQAKAAKPATTAGREDLTHLPLLTIDPEDARDHDDAVWAAPDEDPKNAGGHVVIVAIADVAAYVTPGSALDRGALERGNSVYFPDRVVPMLPERLSTDLCSLKEKQKRPCLAVRMVFDKAGHKRSHAFMRATMRSAAKLSYEQAQAAIDGKPDAKSKALLEPALKPLWAAYRAVATARSARAPLDLDMPERKVTLGANRTVQEITRRERFDAHRLIEEFMILANVCAAESLEAKRSGLIYRVHDTPSKEKLAALADFLPTVGLSWNKAEPATPKRFNHLLTKARVAPKNGAQQNGGEGGDGGSDKGGDHADAVGEMVLRSQAQAVYSPENLGHFGLNLQRYAHFTSPIRRYADLIVHRALIRALNLGPDPSRDGLSEDELPRLDTIAERISTTERRAMAAERDATDRYLAAYLSERVDTVFEARITGVTRAGCFLRLEETGADGLAPVSRLGLEYFRHDAGAQALIGEDTGGRYRLGMKVQARLVEAAPISGGLLFELETPPEPGKSGRHSGARKSPRGRASNAKPRRSGQNKARKAKGRKR